MTGAVQLDLAFDDKAIRYVCESDLRARKLFGAEAASRLRLRLADLEAVECLVEIDWAPVVLGATSATIEFYPNMLLLVEPGGTKIPFDQAGKVNWHAVQRVRIMKVIQ